MIKHILILLLISQNLFSLEKPTNENFMEVIKLPCTPVELRKLYGEGRKAKEGVANFLKGKLGNRTLTLKVLLTPEFDMEEGQFEFKVLDPSNFAKTIFKEATVCNQKHFKSNQTLKENSNFIFGELTLERDNLIKSRVLYRYNKNTKKIDSLSIAKKGSNKLSEGLVIIQTNK